MLGTVLNNKVSPISHFALKGMAIPFLTTSNKILGNRTSLNKKDNSKNSFEIVSKEFDIKFHLEFDIAKTIILSKSLRFPLHFNDNILIATFKGKLEHDEFITENFFLDLQKQGKTPASAFFLATLSSIIRLSKSFTVSIPKFKYKLVASIDASVGEINSFLLARNQAFKLMVIEKASGVKLNLPIFENIAGTDLNEIDYGFQSITKRSFEIISNHKEPVGTYKIENTSSEIFGQKINLGMQKLNFSSNKITVESITTPTLPKNAFSKEIQKLIDLETKLNEVVFEKYLNSFSNAFEGLSDEQIEILTEKTKLGGEAFNF